MSVTGIKHKGTLYKALQRLAAAGHVVQQGESQRAPWSLAGASAPVNAFVAAKRAKPPQKPTFASIDLELQQLAARFAPLNRLPEKIVVLDQLSSAITGAVGTLLIEIREDLIRINGRQA